MANQKLVQMTDRLKKIRPAQNSMPQIRPPSAPGIEEPKMGFGGATTKTQVMPGPDGKPYIPQGMGGPSKSTSTADIASDIMGQDSKIMQRSAAQGLQAGNRRGLLNSSMSVEAGQNAVIDNVLPMAQQQSEQIFTAGQTQAEAEIARQQAILNAELQQSQSKLEGNIADRLQTKGSKLDARLAKGQTKLETRLGMKADARNAKLGAKIDKKQTQLESKLSMKESARNAKLLADIEKDQSRLDAILAIKANAKGAKLDSKLQKEQTTLEGRITARQTEREALLASKQIAQEGDIEAGLQETRLNNDKWLATLDADTRSGLMEQERAMRESLAQLDISASEREDAGAMVTSMHEFYQESMRSTLSNPNLPADVRNDLLQNAAQLLDLQTDMVGDLYGFDFDWDAGSYSPTGEQPEIDPETGEVIPAEPTPTTPNPTIPTPQVNVYWGNPDTNQ